MQNATRLLIVLAAVVLAAAFDSGRSEAQPPPFVEPMVWQFNRDYPEGSPADSSLPIDTVYIKTHDGTDWMSTYDSHPSAVSGPGAIESLINTYRNQGVEVAAWFVPKGTDYETQVQMALQVIDSGVTAFYADLEPFRGFCFLDCAPLAIAFWTRVRLERPDARLGVIYDPRPWWWGASATSLWFANADVAMPMCYWESYSGQGAFGDPGGCVAQAKADLATLSPNRSLEYLPILQGDSSADRMSQAFDAAIRAEASRVSLWRRGVVSGDVWNMIAGYQAPSGPHCAVQLGDGCLIRDSGQTTVYLMQGGAKFPFRSAGEFVGMGFDWREVQVMPAGVVAGLPSIPADGTLLQEFGGDTVFVIAGGAKFALPPGTPASGAETPRVVPPGGTDQIPTIPGDFSRIREESATDTFVIMRGGRFQLESVGESVLAELGHGERPTFVVPNGGLAQIPVLDLKRGDVDCDGSVGITDVLGVIRKTINLPSGSACIGLAGDVTCDGLTLTNDALLLLLFYAETPFTLGGNCAPVGEPHPALLPAAAELQG